VARLLGAELLRGDPDALIHGAAPLESAGRRRSHVLDNPKYVKELAGTGATACICPPRYSSRVPSGVAVLECAEPYRAYALYLAAVYPSALRPSTIVTDGWGPEALVHPEAMVEEGVKVEPGATVGPRAEIGRGTTVGAGAVIGAAVAIGRDCHIGPQSTSPAFSPW
jgi:UDP-3-O-[3-hydroxymyristoyl] glucosamine N-acyltransferase